MAAGKEDIAPELLKKVQEDYRKRCENDKELARIEALAESGKANGKDTDAYAVRAGELLAAALHDNVSGDVLPDGKMYFNIANRVLPPVLRDNYELVAGMSTRIQQVLNDNAGLHMKALRPDLNEDRVKGLVNLAASADQYKDKRKELEADVVNFSQRISADGFHKNAEFQYTSGFTPKIRREAESGCCEWCQALEGTYDYADVRDTGNDVWRRHRGCRCIVEYDPGTGRRQNARTKTWSQADDHRKKIEDAERMMEERERENAEKNTKTEAEYLRNNLPKGFIDNREIGNPISQKDLDIIRRKAEENGIQLGRDGANIEFDTYCGDPKILLEIIDEVAKEKKKYEINKIILEYDNVLGYEGDHSKIDIDAFAEAKGNTIRLNKYMFDDSNYLVSAYNEAVAERLFAKGTSYINIADHEMGHLVRKKYPELYDRVTGVLQTRANNANMSLEEYIKANISIYAGTLNKNSQYGELIPELNAMLNGSEGEFARVVLEGR